MEGEKGLVEAAAAENILYIVSLFTAIPYTYYMKLILLKAFALCHAIDRRNRCLQKGGSGDLSAVLLGLRHRSYPGSF